ncbi:hypothetical protein LTR37_008507 [Vermiconidia calcicola]|uniref:Uncharacterized protein n=1 Tax=Vermiconidia calcicola TaxID=1690605 RepID=A0ACC3NAD7_9PEZI|nr:hypothetical protein LTR37_008507 [Vermiconidia calcicola]
MDSGLQVRETPESSGAQYYDHSADVQKEVSRPSYPYNLLDNANANEGRLKAIDRASTRHKIRGLSPLMFGLLVALITAVVVGASVGSGLGSALAEARSGTPTATVSVTSTVTARSEALASPTTNSQGQLVNYAVVPPSDVFSVALDCPNLEGKSYTTTSGDVFSLSCTNGWGGEDLHTFLAYTYQDCINACSYYNYRRNGELVCNTRQLWIAGMPWKLLAEGTE